VIVDAWQEARSCLVGRYVIMPNNIHLFCAPGVFPPEPLKQWVRY
jgi:putative transposase